MLPVKVALVSRTTQVSFEELSHVAAALTMQVSRDVTPIWGLAATVQAFPHANHVPAGYWPMYVVDNLPPTEGGFHLTRHKQPYAKVEAGDTWSLSASHELVEMLVDPSGNRLVVGPELAVLSNGTIGENHHKQVEYLVEACDPCESDHCAYLVEDVVVSDFFTPHYHDPVKSHGARYSFTGKLTHPRQVLDGGYISWFDPSTGEVMQLQNFGGHPRVLNLSQGQAIEHGSLRELAHSATAEGPKLSRSTANRELLDLRSSRSGAIRTTAERRAALYSA